MWFIVVTAFIIAFWAIVIVVSVVFSIPMITMYRVIAVFSVGILAAELADRIV